MSVDKKVNYDVQGGVKNYLGKQKEVKAPLKWQSSPDHPTTELAYITEAEKNLLVKQDLHGSLKGGVNRGPSGIMSLNGWGSTDEGQNVSGATASAAESGTSTSDTLAAGMSNQDVKDFQSAAINAGAGQKVNPGFFDDRYTVSPDVLEEAKKYRQNPNNLYANQAFKKTHGGGLGSFISGGGIIGGLIKNVGQAFGLGKKYNEPTYDMSFGNDLGLHADRFPSGFGIPNFESGDGDYDMLGNKINEITGEIISPTGDSLGFIPGYPGGPGSNDGGITTIPQGGSDEYVKLVEKFLPKSTMPEDEELLGGFKSRFLQNRPKEEKEAIEKMINEKFKYDYNSFGLGDMDGS